MCSFVGRLDPPPCLTAMFITVDTMMISWCPPYTLMGITISQYSANITEFVRSMDYNQVVVTELPPTFTNETSLLVSSVSSENCGLYEICVQGETEAGLGQENCIRRTTCLGNVK